MKLTAQIVAEQLIDEEEDTKDTTMTLECEGLDSADVVLSIDGKRYKIDGGDLVEGVTRIAFELPVKKSEDD